MSITNFGLYFYGLTFLKKIFFPCRELNNILNKKIRWAPVLLKSCHVKSENNLSTLRNRFSQHEFLKISKLWSTIYILRYLSCSCRVNALKSSSFHFWLPWKFVAISKKNDPRIFFLVTFLPTSFTSQPSSCRITLDWNHFWSTVVIK